MTILITGATGFLGRRAAVYFSSLGYDVLTPSHSQLDITDKIAVDNWFRKNCPQAVIHCAAVSDTGKCQQDPESTALINVQGSVHLAEACAQIDSKFVFCSSDQVYAGSPLPGPHRESEPLHPGNVYACQKILAEQRCSALCPNTVCLRLSWMYTGQFLPEEHGHLLLTLAKALQSESTPLSWPVYDHRGITDVDSVVRQLPRALELPAGVYNFGSENNQTTYHTLKSVFESLGLEEAQNRLTANVQAFSDAPRDIRMDCSLAASYGIHFESTQTGLCSALIKIL